MTTTGGGNPRPHDGVERDEPVFGPISSSGVGSESFTDHWLNPALIHCPCRHCRKGRMCQKMADLYRRAVRRDGELIRDLDRRLEHAELLLPPPVDRSWLQVEDT